jgi:hypothetical protein
MNRIKFLSFIGFFSMAAFLSLGSLNAKEKKEKKQSEEKKEVAPKRENNKPERIPWVIKKEPETAQADQPQNARKEPEQKKS